MRASLKLMARRVLPAAALAVSLGAGLAGCDSGTDAAETGAWQTRPADTFPTANTGTSAGSVLANHSFLTVGGASYTLKDEVFVPGAKVMVLATAAEWCTACREEAPKLQDLHDDYRDRGLQVLVTLFETADFDPAGAAQAAAWVDLYGVTYPVVADPEFQMEAYYDPQLTPMVMVVDVDDMSIKSITTGYNESDVRALLDVLL